ncbi:hypothetical protein BLNAU_7685 [Blattamonas nauphoetae]|uniref:Uncharacterized protein n=1 Tax=Blattamonas nauphoetae TaxID=2049346 RepID=A0ABQ9Y0P1_9EUKA|nr:hypothetical protein BLNAU_7685 [Blattamonas nauphoetae]
MKNGTLCPPSADLLARDRVFACLSFDACLWMSNFQPDGEQVVDFLLLPTFMIAFTQYIPTTLQVISFTTFPSSLPAVTGNLNTPCMSSDFHPVPPAAVPKVASIDVDCRWDIMHLMYSFLGEVSMNRELTKLSIMNFSIVLTPIFFEDSNQTTFSSHALKFFMQNTKFVSAPTRNASSAPTLPGQSAQLVGRGLEEGEMYFYYAFDWPGEGWMLGEVKGELGMLPLNFFRVSWMGEEKKREEERKGEKERKMKEEKKEEVVQSTLSILPSDRSPDKPRLRKCWSECVWEAVFQETKKDAVAVCLQSREEDVVGEEGEQAQLLQCDLPNSLHSVDSWKGRNDGARNKGRRVFEHTGDAGDKAPKEDAAIFDRFRNERLRTIRMGAIAPVALVDAQAIPPDPRHSVLPPPPPNTPPTISLSLSTISPSSCPNLLVVHIPNTPVVD